MINANFGQAVQYAEEALQITEKTENKKLIALALRKIGNVYHYQSIYEKSVAYYLQALKLAEEAGDTANMALCYNNLGNEYSSIDAISNAKTDYEKSLKFHFQAFLS